MSKALRVARVPELIGYIFELLDSSYYLYRLLRVSKHFFGVAGPLIWKEVPRMEILLSLIRGTVVRRSVGVLLLQFSSLLILVSKLFSIPESILLCPTR